MQAHFPALEELKTGNDAAWSVAFSYLWPIALRNAQQSVPQLTLPEAEEVASDAIRYAIDQIEHVRAEADLRALVAVIARRRAVTMLREKFAAKRAPGGALVESSEVQQDYAFFDEETMRDPCRDLMEAERIALLHQALSSLDPQSRELLRQKYVEGFSYEELSKKHNIPVGTLCPKLMRALRKLRRMLEDSPEIKKELEAFLR